MFSINFLRSQSVQSVFAEDFTRAIVCRLQVVCFPETRYRLIVNYNPSPVFAFFFLVVRFRLLRTNCNLLSSCKNGVVTQARVVAKAKWRPKFVTIVVIS